MSKILNTLIQNSMVWRGREYIQAGSLRYEYPSDLVPKGKSPAAFLKTKAVIDRPLAACERHSGKRGGSYSRYGWETVRPEPSYKSTSGRFQRFSLTN